MNDLQQLTKKIHKHCPELMELSFGCWIQSDSKDGTKYRFLGKDNKVEIPKLTLLTEAGTAIKRNMWHFGYFVLGHPIQLEHVLKAINNDYRNWHQEEYGVAVELMENKAFVELKTNEHGTALWTLTKPLSEQSEDVIRWLNEIIV